MTNFKSRPYRAVEFNRKAIINALEAAGSLLCEIKYDGIRGMLVVETREDTYAEAHWRTREDKPIPSLEYLNSVWGGQYAQWEGFLNDFSCIAPKGMMIDCELMVSGLSFQKSCGVLRSKWVSETNRMFHTEPENLPDVVKKSQKIPFKLDPQFLDVVVFAVLPIAEAKAGDDYMVMNCIMQTHADVTVGILNKHIEGIGWRSPARFEVFSMESLDMLFEDVTKQGHEGIIVKDNFGFYRRGKKTGWWKMKPEATVDGTVCGLVWGTKGKDNEGKVVGFEVLLEDDMVVNATGLTQDMMEEVTTKVWAAIDAAFIPIRANTVADWDDNFTIVNPYDGWQVELTYMERTDDGSLRHPNFSCWRGTEDNPTIKS